MNNEDLCSSAAAHTKRPISWALVGFTSSTMELGNVKANSDLSCWYVVVGFMCVFRSNWHSHNRAKC